MKNVSLGPLEQEVISCVWKNKTCTTRDIFQCLNQDRKIAYNTIQTVMTRLVAKGLLERNLQGKKHIYRSKAKHRNTLQSLINQTMGGFIHQFGDDALLAFVDGIDELSDETRKKLINKLQQK